MSHVAIIGCGIVGATIAYELSLVSGLKITVLDQYPPAQAGLFHSRKVPQAGSLGLQKPSLPAQAITILRHLVRGGGLRSCSRTLQGVGFQENETALPAQGSTGAALGVLMGGISKKVKGKAWQLRQASMKRYETLIPELEAITGRHIPFNRQGILMLCFAEEELASWQPLLATRQSQGWHLEIWDTAQIHSHCPQLHHNQIVGAVYSPQDRQVDPTALTQALVAAAERNGVTFKFGAAVEEVKSTVTDASDLRLCQQIHTNVEQLDVDWLVVASGLGSSQLTAALKQPIDIRPVLGQALHLRIGHFLGNTEFQPVITGDDVHIVPVGEGEYWVGATVEFANQAGEVVAEPMLLEKVKQAAFSYCPALAEATILGTWSGKRPRPEGRPAPIIGHLPGYSNVLLATGHYRNGVLLAPATAEAIREMIHLH